MLYRCHKIVLDLTRVISVSEIGSNRLFHLGIIGASHIYFEAADGSRVALEKLEADRHALLTAWQAHRNGRPRGRGSIVRIGEFHVNAAALAAVGDVERRQLGMSGAWGNHVFNYRFDVHIMGYNDIIYQTCPDDDKPAIAELRTAHAHILDVWRSLYEPETA